MEEYFRKIFFSYLKSIPSGNKNGLTLIELIIIVTIVSILGATIAVYFTRGYTYRLDAARSKLASDIKYVQQLAITKQKNFGICFEPEENRYYAYVESTENNIKHPLTRDNFIVDYNQDSKFSGVNLVSTNLAGNLLQFNPIGEPSDGESLLDYEGRINISYKEQSYIIKIEKNTGKIGVE